MDQARKQKFIATYGFDPDSVGVKYTTPTMGAVSGVESTEVGATPSAKELLAQIRGGKTTNTTSSTSNKSATQLALEKIRSEQSAGEVSQSGYKPGKFIQTLEDSRPNYIEKGQGSGKDGRRTIGDTYKNIGEGLGDVGVGVVKGIVRTIPEIVQTLTPDKMWGENSLLNSESDKANAFRSATTGKTGLQKLGATATDIASLYAPVGALGKGLSLAERGAQGASRLAKMATSGVDLAAEAPSVLQRAGKALNTVAPSIGESVVAGSITGRGESPVTDIALGTISPLAGKAVGVISDAVGSQKAKLAMAGAKDYIMGGNVYKQQILDSAMKHIDDMGADALRQSIPQIETNRTAFRDILKPKIAKMFGTGSKGLDKLNEASDIFTLGYFDKLDVVDGLVDYTKAQDALRADKDVIGSIISKASSTIRDKSIPTGRALKSLSGKMQSTGINKYDEGYQEAKQLVSDFIAKNTNGGKNDLTVQMLDGLRSSLTKRIQSLQPTQAEMKKLYSEIYSWTNDMVYKIAKDSGEQDVAELIKEASSSYSKLKNVDSIVDAMSKTRLNPFGLSQGQKIAISYGAGGLGGAVSGPFGVPAGMIVAGPLQKIISNGMTKRAISNVKSNIYTKASALKRFEKQSGLTNKLSEIIKKQSVK